MISVTTRCFSGSDSLRMAVATHVLRWFSKVMALTRSSACCTALTCFSG
jgi:hypothetical protein